MNEPILVALKMIKDTVEKEKEKSAKQFDFLDYKDGIEMVVESTPKKSENTVQEKVSGYAFLYKKKKEREKAEEEESEYKKRIEKSSSSNNSTK